MERKSEERGKGCDKGRKPRERIKRGGSWTKKGMMKWRGDGVDGKRKAGAETRIEEKN